VVPVWLWCNFLKRCTGCAQTFFGVSCNSPRTWHRQRFSVCFTGFNHDSDLPDAPHDPRRLNVHHDRHIADEIGSTDVGTKPTDESRMLSSALKSLDIQ